MKNKLFKKVYLILVCLSISFGILKAEKIQKYFVQERYYSLLVKLNLIKKCYDPYGSFVSFFEQEGFDYKKEDQEVTLNSFNKLKDKNIVSNSESKIPTITHHIYFTPSINSKALPEFYIEKMKANFIRLNNLGGAWHHYIWTNNPKIFSDGLINMKGVVIKNVSEFKEHSLYEYILKTIDKGNVTRAHLMEASDIIRLMALQKFGGIYSDIDYEIYNAEALFELMKKFDFIGGREFPGLLNYYGNAFMVSKPNHPVINEAISRLELYNIYPKGPNIPEYIKYTCGLFEKLYFNSPPLLTISYFKKNNIEGNNDIILPSWMVFNANFAHLKNGGCSYTKFNKQTLSDEKILNEAILEFSKKPTAEFFNVSEKEKHPRDDIYYDLEYRDGFEIIGADMFCGTWSYNLKNKKFYYWNWPLFEFVRSNEN